MLRKRYIIEYMNELLKNNANFVHSRHRSIHNFIMNSFFALTAYCFLEINRRDCLYMQINQASLNYLNTIIILNQHINCTKTHSLLLSDLEGVNLFSTVHYNSIHYILVEIKEMQPRFDCISYHFSSPIIYGTKTLYTLLPTFTTQVFRIIGINKFCWPLPEKTCLPFAANTATS